MGFLAERLDRTAWRRLGFELSPQEIAEVERFFETWFAIYNRPGIGAYRSREALFATERVLRDLFGEQLSDGDRRNAVSALRAGYCVAVTETDLSMRTEPDPHLSELFTLMAQDDRLGSLELLAAAWQRGTRLAEVASKLVGEQPNTVRSFPGFRLREAVFADLRTTLFVKLKLTALPGRFTNAEGEEAMRQGHVVGVCEEALTATTPPDAHLN